MVIKRLKIKALLAIICSFILSVTLSFVSFAATEPFSDVKNSDWFYNDVITLSEKNIISGYTDGSFKPNNTVTLGEFLALGTRLVAENKIPSENPGDHWAIPFYIAAVNSNLISANEFKGDSKSLSAKITREDMAYLLVNIAFAEGENLSTIPGIETSIKDFNKISKNRQSAVLKAYSNGLLAGSGNNFKPKDYLRRSEVSAVLCRVMNYTPRPTVTFVLGESTINESNKVLELINKERAKAGVPALTMHKKLAEVAQVKAEELARLGRLSHDSLDYGTVGQMLCYFGVDWNYCGENIASGQTTPDKVVNDWMNSEPHRLNALSENFVQTGIAYAKNKNGRVYWVQLFARP